jgi:hypothetical protein
MPPDRRPRILLHPGFHKTGTSSIQHLLWTNRKLLAPHVAVLLLRHLKPATEICMHYSRHQSPVALTNLVAAMDGILAEHYPAGDSRDLLISCEGLSGHLPGWPGVMDYRAAPVTALFLAGILSERRPGADLRIIYTTRDPDAWLHSAWRHYLFGHRLRLDWPAFAARYRPAADLDAVVAQTARAVDPVPVAAISLSDAAQHPLGPGGAILGLLDLLEGVTARVVPVGHGNAGPDAALAAAYLKLNLSVLGDAEVKEQKAALAALHGAGGWARVPRLPNRP